MVLTVKGKAQAVVQDAEAYQRLLDIAARADIYEALRQGVHVIACDRGSIAEMLGNGAGLAVARDEIVASAAARLAQFSDDRDALADAKRRSIQQANRVRCAGRVALEDLLVCMQNNYQPVRL